MVGGLLILAMALPGLVRGQANSWTNTSGGNWEIGANWSLGVAPSNTHSVFITNAFSKTVTIDSITAGTATMTASNLTVSAPVAAVNTLRLTNAGTATALHILNAATISGGGVVLLTNSVAQIDDGLAIDAATANASLTLQTTGRVAVVGPVTVSGSANSTGQVNILAGGQLVVTNTPASVGAGSGFIIDGSVTLTNGSSVIATNLPLFSTIIGNRGSGSLTMNGGSLSLGVVHIGENAGAQGTLTLAGGTNVVRGELRVGSGTGATGAVWITGSAAQLVSTNFQPINIGDLGVGQMTVSNGIVLSSQISVGNSSGSQGTLTMVDGTNRVLSSGLRIGGGAGFSSTGTVWLTGGAGQLVTTNGNPAEIGFVGNGQMIVSNGLWLAGEVRVGVSDSGSGRGTLTVAGGTSRLTSALYIGGQSNSATSFVISGTGTVWVTGGQLEVTNNDTVIGNYSVGQMTVSNGTWLAQKVFVGRYDGAQGTLTVSGGTDTLAGTTFVGYKGIGQMSVSGGTNTLASALYIGGAYDEDLFDYVKGTGTVWMTGGLLVVTNDTTWVGVAGLGQMTVSNGTWLARDVIVPYSPPGSQGTLTIAGGTNKLSLALSVGEQNTGILWVTGGQLVVTNDYTVIGGGGVGQMTVSNGTWLAKNVKVASEPGQHGRGTLTIAGGISCVYSNMTVGTPTCAGTGIVNIVGGELDVTNALANATLEVRSGTLTLNSDTLLVDKFVMTNACGFFTRTGGTLIYGTAVLSSNRDDDGDGIRNGYEQSHGLDPLNPADANLDSDGDGQSNLQEYLAGTDATNSASFFGITAVAKESNNIRVTWMTGVGKTNALERASGTVAGSYSNNFTVIFTVTNTVGTTTNHLDVGVATNASAFYYRVRLVP